jgi:hypothetical protein
MRFKQGQIHVEIILATVLFIGTVFVLLVFFNPLGSQKINDNAINEVEARIFDNITTDLYNLRLFLNQSANESECHNFDVKIKGLNLFKGKIIVFDNNSLAVDSKRELRQSRDSFQIELNNYSTFYKVYISNELKDDIHGNPGACEDTNLAYQFGPLTYENAVLFEYIEDFNKSYVSDYNTLRSALGIRNEFVFVVTDLDGKVIFNDSLSQRVFNSNTVLSRQIPFSVVYRNATRRDMLFNLAVW